MRTDMELSNEFNLKEIEQTTKNYLSKVDLKKLMVIMFIF